MFRAGVSFPLLAAIALVGSLLLLLGLLFLISFEGSRHFWPKSVAEIQTPDGILYGSIRSDLPRDPEMLLIEVGRDPGGSIIKPVPRSAIAEVRYPSDAAVVTRTSAGPLFGRVLGWTTSARDMPLQPADSSPPDQAYWHLDIGGSTQILPATEVEDMIFVNALSFPERIVASASAAWEFLSEPPRSGGRGGGMAPAIVGMVVMVLLMTIAMVPFGLLAALYLSEFAREDAFTRGIRFALFNLAGTPSIVYGVFGLAFFVYGLGASLDEALRPADALPLFGTGTLLWASLTMALLTMPTLIIAVEDGLRRVPVAAREGALALGASRGEVIRKIVLPTAAPALGAGVVLAMARATAEVAPLMLVGVVKLAPAPIIELERPFLHPERQFMHLGFEVYDLATQSPDVEATMSLAYASCLLLLLTVGFLHLIAIWIRRKLETRYRQINAFSP